LRCDLALHLRARNAATGGRVQQSFSARHGRDER